ncbi:MAG: HXXEE domain-containing protein [Planctomycetota bacterium]
MFERLVSYWVYGGFLCSFVLIAFGCVLFRDSPLGFVLGFLHLPAYQWHQLEEHDADRFRHYVNESIGKGRTLLTPQAVFIINVFGVWAVFTVLILLAYTIHIGFALGLAYPTLINAVVHLVPALIHRQSNPGLLTGIGLFLPLSMFTIWTLSHTEGVSVSYHALGLMIGIAIHAAIVVYVLGRLRSQTNARTE